MKIYIVGSVASGKTTLTKENQTANTRHTYKENQYSDSRLYSESSAALSNR